LSAFLADFFRERRETNRAKSLVVACLDSVYMQMPEVELFFRSLSKVGWTGENISTSFSFSKTLLPIDLSSFDKVREKLLALNVDLANTIVRYELYIRRINREVKGWRELLSEDYLAQRQMERDQLPGYLNRNSKFFKKEVELIISLTNLTVNLREQLFKGEKKIDVDWETVAKKSQETLQAIEETMPPGRIDT
jgi:hypothetical protein